MYFLLKINYDFKKEIYNLEDNYFATFYKENFKNDIPEEKDMQLLKLMLEKFKIIFEKWYNDNDNAEVKENINKNIINNYCYSASSMLINMFLFFFILRTSNTWP